MSRSIRQAHTIPIFQMSLLIGARVVSAFPEQVSDLALMPCVARVVGQAWPLVAKAMPHSIAKGSSDPSGLPRAGHVVPAAALVGQAVEHNMLGRHAPMSTHSRCSFAA